MSEDRHRDSAAPHAYTASKTPVPKGVRKLSGTMLLRFNEAIHRLEEPSKRLDEARTKTRDILSEEEQVEAFPKPITLVDEEELIPVVVDKE